MYLKDLITFLEKQDPNKVVPYGFHAPHSHRGDYSELAFEPTENITFGEMLSEARSAVGATFEGYKGGDFKMSEFTPVYIANYGETGSGISPTLLKYMAL